MSIQSIQLADLRPPAHNPRFGIYHLFLRDPDGHLVEIQRFDDADWAKGGES